MVGLDALVLPILVATGISFLAGFLTWVVLPHHRLDWKQLPREADVLECLARVDLPPGQYAFPHKATKDAMRDPEWIRKAEKGPSGTLVIRRPGPLGMGRAMLLGVAHNLVICTLVAYLGSLLLPAGTRYLMVFRVTSVAAFLGYAGSWAASSIWFDRSWGETFRHVLDGLLYALLVAGTFGWLWPR